MKTDHLKILLLQSQSTHCKGIAVYIKVARNHQQKFLMKVFWSGKSLPLEYSEQVVAHPILTQKLKKNSFCMVVLSLLRTLQRLRAQRTAAKEKKLSGMALKDSQQTATAVNTSTYSILRGKKLQLKDFILMKGIISPEMKKMIGKKFDIKDENLTEKMHIEILDEIRKVIDNSTTNRQQTIQLKSVLEAKYKGNWQVIIGTDQLNIYLNKKVMKFFIQLQTQTKYIILFRMGSIQKEKQNDE